MEQWMIDLLSQAPLAALIGWLAWHERLERKAAQERLISHLERENQRLLDETLPVKPE